jgi:hypothetical protein
VVGNPSNSTITNTGDDTTKRSVKGSESQATRKILESSTSSVHEEAIPPMSPPGLFKDMLMRT